MLAKFSVSNFKSFNKEITFDLKNTNKYEFNKECIKNGIVNNALVYGYNGVGKSNFGLAIFDIIEHLTDKNKNHTIYKNYLNALSNAKTAKFKYEFLIDSNVVEYEYEKSDYETIILEKFSINNTILAFIDRRINNHATIAFKGAENLKTEIENNRLSILKYIKNNSILDDNEYNRTFINFFHFIEGMLFFRHLQTNIYLGLEIGIRDVQEELIRNQNVKNLEKFLNKAGVECKLTVIKEGGIKDVIAFDFDGKAIPFEQIASSGTLAVFLFYYWFIKLKIEKKVSFLFIDEFDAFYHHKLSALIVEELKKTGIQFVLTTHNTSNISNDLLRPDCYFLINKNAIKSLAKSTSKELREAHNIEKMYKAGLFNG